MDFEEKFRMKVKETINIKELNVKVGVIGIKRNFTSTLASKEQLTK